MAHEPATRIAGHNLQFLKYNLPQHGNWGAFSAWFLFSPLLLGLYLSLRLNWCGATGEILLWYFFQRDETTSTGRTFKRHQRLVNDEADEKQRIYSPASTLALAATWTLAPKLIVHIKPDLSLITHALQQNPAWWMIMFSSSPVCYVRQLFLFKHITEQNTDDSINHTRLRGPTVIPMQISCPINAGLRIPTGTELPTQTQSVPQQKQWTSRLPGYCQRLAHQYLELTKQVWSQTLQSQVDWYKLMTLHNTVMRTFFFRGPYLLPNQSHPSYSCGIFTVLH